MTNPTEQCLFCKIANGEIPEYLLPKKIFEDDDVVAFDDINPQAPVHFLAIPRRHIASLDELAAGDEAIMGRVMHRAAALARERHLEAGGYRTVINCGAGAGQTVFHIHVHVLGGRLFGWPPG